MGRYTKIASKYILAKFHQNTSQGALFERDWTTIGNIHRLEPGKRAVYGSSNFLFTENSLPVYKKKRKSGKWVGSYVYDDVMDAEDLVNLIKVNTDSENLSDYAYWGSMSELFRGSVEHIIKTFPGRLRSTKKRLSIHHHIDGNPEYWADANGYILGNPFDLDMHTTEQNGDINPEDLLKYIALSWRNYNVEDYDVGTVYPMDSYTVYEDYIVYDCERRYFRLYNIVLFYGKGNFLIIDVYLADGKIVYVYRTEKDPDTPPGWFDFFIDYYSGIGSSGNSSKSSSEADMSQENGRSADIDDIFGNWYIPNDFGICPSESVLADYFRRLEGFEWKLLNTRTKPYYRNTFLLPVQLDNGNWKLVRRTYTWPSEGVWIDIESTDFESFINGMVDLCEVYDSLWCDSIWRCMVHESVKNFDWSYRREYDDNDAVDNIEGGNRMKDVMRLYGIIYDKAKRYVDGISMFNTVSYDGYNNCPNAQISDRNLLQGWDVTSTQHQFYWYEEFSGKQNVTFTPLPVLPFNVDEDSPEYVSITCPGANAYYYVKKSIPVSDISLESLFFEEGIVADGQNPWVPTNVYGRLYTEVGYASVTPSTYDFSLPNRTFNDFPYQLFDGMSYEPFVMVVSNTGKRYYKLLPNENAIKDNNTRFSNGVWFETVNENAVNTATTDILFNRVLNLSSNRILKTKGTKESIEMAFALFGFGRYDENENIHGDYIIEEQHTRYIAKDYDSMFYFYEAIEQEETDGYTVVTVDELPKNPTGETSPQFIKIVTDTGDGSSFDTYYKLNGQYTVGEAIKLLYAHRTTERIYNDYYSGVPINDEYRATKHLVVPFMDSRRTYEGNPYFEGNGGWMKTGEYTWDYSETIPYLHILQRISDLFRINPSSLSNDDIYFVADVSDYYTYTDNVPYYLSNYFKLLDRYNSTLFSSWVNVPIDGPIANGGNTGIEGVTKEDYLHAKHLDSIIPSILFNNPHCGYDRYDMGEMYKEYMSHPYRYSVENEEYDDDYYANMASQFEFDSTSIYTTTDDGVYDSKTIVTAQTDSYVTADAASRRKKKKSDDDTEETPETATQQQTVDVDYSYVNDKYLKITLLDDGTPIDVNIEKYRMHLEYMRNVVMKYVVQVVPSTTLLVLDNFITLEPDANDTATITVNVVGEGTVYGGGEYLKSSMVTLKAVPAEGWHFYGWRGFSGRESSPSQTTQAEPFGSYEDTVTVMVCDDNTYTAVFVEDCAIGYGCNVLNCGGSLPSV